LFVCVAIWIGSFRTVEAPNVSNNSNTHVCARSFIININNNNELSVITQKLSRESVSLSLVIMIIMLLTGRID